MDLYADEGQIDAPKENAFKSMFWEGGTQGDAFLTSAAAQVAATSDQLSVLPFAYHIICYSGHDTLGDVCCA